MNYKVNYRSVKFKSTCPLSSIEQSKSLKILEGNNSLQKMIENSNDLKEQSDFGLVEKNTGLNELNQRNRSVRYLYSGRSRVQIPAFCKLFPVLLSLILDGFAQLIKLFLHCPCCQLTRQHQKSEKRFLSSDSNPDHMGVERECFLCAMAAPPHSLLRVSL